MYPDDDFWSPEAVRGRELIGEGDRVLRQIEERRSRQPPAIEAPPPPPEEPSEPATVEPRNAHGVRTLGPDLVRQPPAAGEISSRAAYRNALQAADPDADADEVLPEAVAEMVDLKLKATGRDPNRPAGTI